MGSGRSKESNGTEVSGYTFPWFAATTRKRVARFGRAKQRFVPVCVRTRDWKVIMATTDHDELQHDFKRLDAQKYRCDACRGWGNHCLSYDLRILGRIR